MCSGLLSRGEFEVVHRETVPRDANILSVRFVLEIKSADTRTPSYKARFVMQGHRDRDKHILVQNSSKARPESVRILVSVAAMRRYAPW